MTSQTHLAIDGYVDAIPIPGTRWGTATFDLIHSPSNADRIAPDTPDTMYACTTGDPRIAHALLNEIQPGDLLRVTGTVVQPDDPTDPALLAVDAMEVLEAAPAPVLREMVIDRYADYVVIFDADSDTVPVFTAQGLWVGLADNPDAIATLIDIYERVHGGDA
ncbi:hypothetical protein [Streptomyces sp. NPDC048445]|uniref:hypothetical protein n=1 Tax=Streptomyces sp. NPDC048445 TaxID=3365553 RepID=UPI0037179258